MAKDTLCEIVEGNCYDWIDENPDVSFHLTFLDPPFNRKKSYRLYYDNRRFDKYWAEIDELLSEIYNRTCYGGSIYFMHREKQIEYLLAALGDTKWNIKNLIIWKKQTSPPPSCNHFNRNYQVIAYAIKGKQPKVFNKLKIDAPQPPHHKKPKKDGFFLTGVWDDIKELSSGYFAGKEAIRDIEGTRIHLQQTPIALLLRIILSSTIPGNTVFDPMAGTGTTAIVSSQLGRKSINVELDPFNVQIMRERLEIVNPADNIMQHYNYYRYTPELKTIWSEK